MSAEAFTLLGRAAAEQLMVDACTITRETSHTTDPDTGVRTPTFATVYDGRCRIQQQTGVSRPATTGEALVYQLPITVQVPMSVTGVQVDDIVTITASVLDPDLAGRDLWVRELYHKTHATCRRLGCEEVTS